MGFYGSRFYIIRLFGSRTPHQLADSSVLEMDSPVAPFPGLTMHLLAGSPACDGKD